MRAIETPLEFIPVPDAGPALEPAKPKGGALRVLGISALVLAPCFWQARIQAGDLSSHLYNAWLSTLIEQGRAEGLVVVTQWTNVLFDLLLAGLLQVVGFAAAQRIAVSLCVLNFVWGAFALMSAVSRRRAWHMLPYIAILAYGWVFHLGLFNFYLSMGLCFWALALLWNKRPGYALAALPLLAVAYVAHALPVAWVVGAVLYRWLARQVLPRDRVVLTVAGVAAIYAARRFFMLHYAHRWSPAQAMGITGADQVLIFGPKYFVVAVALLVIWSYLFLKQLDRKGAIRTILGIPFQLFVFIAATVWLLPGAVMLPGFNHALDYINDRMSLAAGITFLALIAGVRPAPWERRALAATLGIYFTFLYVDQRAQNRIEDLMEQTVAQLPPASRVINGLCDNSSRIHPVAHNLDRVCIGKCWSYGNYEPASGAFRVRAAENNPIVVADSIAAEDIEHGKYVVQASDPPLYQIFLRDGRLDTRLLKAGDATASPCFEATPGFGTLAALSLHGSN
jgi:hypothetical protein